MGQWLIRCWIAATLALIAVGFHTQAPLIALQCPPHDSKKYDYPAPENCAALDVLVAISVHDLWLGTGRFIHRNRDDINAVSTLAIAVFTFTLWWVNQGMIRIAREQRADTLRAVKAAEDAAEAAGEQVRIARQAVNANERAWLSVELNSHEGLAFERLGGPRLRINLFIKNIGKTAAMNVHTQVWMFSRATDAPIKGRELAVEQRKTSPTSSRLLLPQDGYDRPWVVGLHPREIREDPLAEDLLHPAIFACVTYQTLPDLALHQTAVCYSLSMQEPDGRFAGLLKVGVFVPSDKLRASVASGGFAD